MSPEIEASLLIERVTRRVRIGRVEIGRGLPIAVQSMCATKTQDIAATLRQIRLLCQAGADIVRLAVDSRRDVEALEQIRNQTDAVLVVDLQENYRLAEKIAPFVEKFRYNPGHLYHHSPQVSVRDKVKYLIDVAGANDCAVRIGVNFGSIDPEKKFGDEDPQHAALCSALEHCEIAESLGFKRYVVSLKSSEPRAVVAINKAFSAQAPHVPIHLGVTEAGLLPDGAIKTRIAFEQLLPLGIGDTLRVSLTLPDEEKDKEVVIAREILDDIAAGRFRSVPESFGKGLNVISCPSCSRVENQAFVRLAERVKQATEAYRDLPLTIAVMGCRVNGPGETDSADIGLWCAPNFVNMKRASVYLGAIAYDQVVDRLMEELRLLIEERGLLD